MLARVFLRYDRGAWQFKEVLERQVGARLEMLSGRPGVNDQDSEWHPRLYKAWGDARLDQTWHWFVRTQLVPIFGGHLVFQVQPTIRVHYPGHVAVSEFHRDSDFGHPHEMCNIWVPLTEVGETNGAELAGLAPRHLRVGDMVVFDGDELHGSPVSAETWTRVSFDARVCEEALFPEGWGGRSVIAGASLALGDYYMSSRDIEM